LGTSHEIGLESFRRALAEERARNMHRLNLFRFGGVSLACALNLILPAFIEAARARQANPYLFAIYAVIAGVIYRLGRDSSAVADSGWLAVPFVDMPIILLLALSSIAKTPGDVSQALFTTSSYLLLIIVSGFSLDSRQIVLSTVVATILEGILLAVAGVDAGGIIGSAAILVGAGILCAYPSRRATHLVRSVAAEQLFLSPDVGRAVQERGLASIVTRTRSHLSIVACDLRGFTRFSEAAETEEVIALLQDYYEAIGEIVTEFGGTVKDHAGDGILSIVGAPIPRPHHADRAVRMALQMRTRASAVLQRWTRPGADLGLGIGIASGSVIVGAIQGATRLEYVAVGPAVTLATRLADAAGPGEILTDEQTVADLKESQPSVAFAGLPARPLQGFAKPVVIFAVQERSG
jgi:class 3 adenylate cyclase